MAVPLEGVRILAISQFGAGPFGTMLLADLGAEVIKIEDPTTRGDVSRYVPPYRLDSDSLYFQSFNRNKKSVSLNLRTAKGREIFHRLVAGSDAVFNNLRGDGSSALGLNYTSLEKINPRVVCCSLSAFGTTGVRVDEPGYDYLVQALAGYMSFTGEPDGPPTKCGVSVIDHAAGFAAALGLMAALFNAKRTGIGCDVDVSLLDTAVSMLTYLATWNLNKGFEPQRISDSSHQTIIPAQNFKTKDGYVVVFCAKEKFWQNLCRILGMPELASDPRCASFDARWENRDFVISTLEPIFAQKKTCEWLTLLRGEVPSAPVNTLGQALNEPQVIARDMIVEVDHPLFGRIKEVGTPIRICGAKRKHVAAPAYGQHTDSILTSLSYTTEQIQNFREEGII